MSKKIGIYGGTFDPIHLGHINLALNLMAQKGLDEVWFCPAYRSPLKEGNEVTTAEQRLAMTMLAIEGIPGCKVIDTEVRRGSVSYTVDTLEELHKLYPQNKFYLLMGNDSAKSFLSWKDPKRIVQLAEPLVGTRANIRDFPIVAGADMGVVTILMEGIVPTPIIEISSTEIRSRLKKGEYIGHLVPQKVVDYILDNSLYS